MKNQLNNTVNGKIIKINDLRNAVRTPVAFSIYENKIFADADLFGDKSNKVEAELDFAVVFDENIDNRDDQIFDIAYQALKASIEFQAGGEFEDYVVSYDEKNWLFPEKPIRVTLLRSLYEEHIKQLDAEGNRTPLGEIFKVAEQLHFGFYYDNENSIVVYVDQINEDDVIIMQPYIDDGQIYSENY